MPFDDEQIKNLSTLLMSPDESNAKIAFEILNHNEFPLSMISELFAFFKTTNDKSLKKQAKVLLEKHGSWEVGEAMKLRYPLKGGNATEKTIKKNIIQYTHNNELNGIKIAQALYKKSGVGATYLLTATPENQRKEMLQTFINGTDFKLQNKAITQFPRELFDFPELTSIDLSENKITSIPKGIEIFKDLEVLNMNKNKLKSIHKNFLKLKKLKVLDISYNNFTNEFPEIIFKMPQLEKLNIVGLRSNFVYSHNLSDGIFNLKNLREFQCDISNRPAYPNYPSIKKVTGSPIDMQPLQIAYTAYDQGDTNPLYYIFNHGSKKHISEILGKYYNAATQTMYLERVYIEKIPEEITQFNIKHLVMKNCGLGELHSLNRYSKEQREEVIKSTPDQLSIINELKDLETLDLSQNRIMKIPDLSNLQLLINLGFAPHFKKFVIRK